MSKDKNKNMIYFIIFLLLVNLGLQIYSLSKKDNKNEGYQTICDITGCSISCTNDGHLSGYCTSNGCQCID